MEAIRSSEASVYTRSTRRHIPEDGNCYCCFVSLSDIPGKATGRRLKSEILGMRSHSLLTATHNKQTGATEGWCSCNAVHFGPVSILSWILVILTEVSRYFLQSLV
jgi:hypothetical protein